MKKFICLVAGLFALNLTPVFGQQPASTFIEHLAAVETANKEAADHAPPLTKFNLDFPGGTPKELVAAIEKAMGKPLNAIIPKENADLQMPPLKMNDVMVPQLFAALKAASRKTVTVSNGYGNGYSQYNGDYGFETGDSGTDASIWFFHVSKPVIPPSDPLQKVCQFYSLSPYLDRGFTVDDITTAIQTGWKMAGVNPTPELNYHKETKLLIAFGEPTKLRTIDDVLRTLPQFNYPDFPSFLTMSHQIIDLQKSVYQLSREIHVPVTNSLPAEKSGK